MKLLNKTSKKKNKISKNKNNKNKFSNKKIKKSDDYTDYIIYLIFALVIYYFFFKSSKGDEKEEKKEEKKENKKDSKTDIVNELFHSQTPTKEVKFIDKRNREIIKENEENEKIKKKKKQLSINIPETPAQSPHFTQERARTPDTKIYTLYKIEKIKGDGNCGFRALIRGGLIKNNKYEEDNIIDLRKNVVKLINNNKNETYGLILNEIKHDKEHFKDYISENDSNEIKIKKYLDRMLKDEWIGGVEFYLLATNYKKNINIIKDDGTIDYHYGEEYPDKIYLYYINNNHYDLLKPTPQRFTLIGNLTTSHSSDDNCIKEVISKGYRLYKSETKPIIKNIEELAEHLNTSEIHNNIISNIHKLDTISNNLHICFIFYKYYKNENENILIKDESINENYDITINILETEINGEPHYNLLSLYGFDAFSAPAPLLLEQQTSDNNDITRVISPQPMPKTPNKPSFTSPEVLNRKTPLLNII